MLLFCKFYIHRPWQFPICQGLLLVCHQPLPTPKRYLTVIDHTLKFWEVGNFHLSWKNKNGVIFKPLLAGTDSKKAPSSSSLVHGLFYGHAEFSVLSSSAGHLDFLSKLLKFLQGFKFFFNHQINILFYLDLTLGKYY